MSTIDIDALFTEIPKTEGPVPKDWLRKYRRKR
jgi:hypothetical protein